MKILTPKHIFDQLSSRSPIDLECLNCKKIFQRNKHRVQDSISQGKSSGAFCCQNCATIHKNTNNHIKLTCYFCQAEIIRTKSDLNKLNKSNKHFCNSSCSAKYHNQFRKKPVTELTCYNCQQKFTKKSYKIHLENKNHFCSKQCLHESITKPENKNLIQKTSKIKIPIHKPTITVNCLNCGKETLKSTYQIKNNKYNYCSRSCHAIHANKTYNRATRFGINKSKSETLLVEIIKKDFPNLNIIENDRQILNGLEIDIYIPEKNIAIELNGPCHFIPIFGQDELSKTQNKDLIKKQKLQELKINFFQINIMGLGKNLIPFLEKSYYEQIKPLLS